MSIGTGIVLFVVGAVLAFALTIELGGIDLDMVGYLLMGAGFLSALIGVILPAQRRRSSTESRTAVDPATGERVARQETSVDENRL